MKQNSVIAGIIGTILYTLRLAILMFFAYLILVLSVPGVGDVQAWARSVNYILTTGLIFIGVSAASMFAFSFFGAYNKEFKFCIKLGIIAAIASVFFSSPLFHLV